MSPIATDEMPAGQEPDACVVAAFYRFTDVADASVLRDELAVKLARIEVRGTVLVAPEGINGTIAGTQASIDAAMAQLRAVPGCGDLTAKRSEAPSMPFHRMKVRLKREIITMGIDGVDAVNDTGTRVRPADWNAVLADPEITVIDTRNHYETAIGTFDGAISPQTSSFSDFPGWFDAKFPDAARQKFAMFCTGGIRCEKASAYLRSKGVGDVLQLDGGILKYLETTPAKKSRWRGECFVFDQRVSVVHGVEQGSLHVCHACRLPLTADDLQHPSHVEGVSCRHCAGRTSAEQKQRYAERHLQVALAAARGATHLGDSSQQPQSRGNQISHEVIRRKR